MQIILYNSKFPVFIQITCFDSNYPVEHEEHESKKRKTTVSPPTQEDYDDFVKGGCASMKEKEDDDDFVKGGCASIKEKEDDDDFVKGGLLCDSEQMIQLLSHVVKLLLIIQSKFASRHYDVPIISYQNINAQQTAFIQNQIWERWILTDLLLPFLYRLRMQPQHGAFFPPVRSRLLPTESRVADIALIKFLTINVVLGEDKNCYTPLTWVAMCRKFNCVEKKRQALLLKMTCKKYQQQYER
ncbi:hypothetical protein LXL04_005122 [Taraxacum kok-saghyz]